MSRSKGSGSSYSKSLAWGSLVEVFRMSIAHVEENLSEGSRNRSIPAKFKVHHEGFLAASHNRRGVRSEELAEEPIWPACLSRRQGNLMSLLWCGDDEIFYLPASRIDVLSWSQFWCQKEPGVMLKSFKLQKKFLSALSPSRYSVSRLQLESVPVLVPNPRW